MTMNSTNNSPKEVASRSAQYTVAVALVAGLGGVMFGYDIGVIADAKKGVEKAFGLDTDAANNLLIIQTIVSSVLAGSFIGALAAGRLCDKIGRRWTNVWGGGFFVVGCLGCAIAVNPWMMIGFRVVMGIGVGFSSVAGPLYIAEIAAPWSRGAMVSLYQLAITVGIFLAMLLGIWLTPSDLWRLAFGLGAILGVGLILGMLAMPPSPRWLVGKGRDTMALSVLKRTMGSIPAAEDELQAIKQKVEEESGTNFLKALASGRALKIALILAIGLAFLQQASGINAIFYYAPEIIEGIGLKDIEFKLTAALSLVNLLATFIAIYLVDRMGRRPLLIGGTILMMLGQIVVGIAYLWLPEMGTSDTTTDEVSIAGIVILVAIFVSVIAFACSLGPLVWLVISEIFPAGVRSVCVGVATSVNWIGNFFIAQGSLSLVDYNAGVAFWIFAGFNLFTIAFVWYLMPETKGIELEKIEDFFKGNNAKKGAGS